MDYSRRQEGVESGYEQRHKDYSSTAEAWSPIVNLSMVVEGHAGPHDGERPGDGLCRIVRGIFAG